ncbi:MAG TPA: hypothetical protein VFC87_07880 [Perlabentimonas sp.]|nr:hypothetical protein [Bacteroidales bacterium]MDD4671932.1 hypothetical protein [Bacteroidales bacterium]MDY0348533.1 hypothetical protein [Tenuifilaceae bacterium]HZJ74708.1 hypothetical protein [Perlabentimonas sp.]
MAYIPFHQICPEVAEKETRVISVLHKDNEFELPVGNYAFVELFCNECDCRRVFFQVFFNQKKVATIAYGWESLHFYRKAFKGFSEQDIKEIKGPTLDSFQYQSDISRGVFKLFNKLLFTDKAYLARIERHYKQFTKML